MPTKSLDEMTFGGFIRAARTMMDLSQKDMAVFLKISKSSLCDIEKGRHIVSIELAAKMAKKCCLPEVMAIKYAINDSLRRARLKFSVEVKKTA